MPKVLVVDDDADVRMILGAILEPVASVSAACDGEEGLRLLAAETPVLMLLDLTMPGVGGLEVLARARALRPDLTVVVLTGALDLTTARAALDAGARSYITKPFDPDAVRAEVVRLTGGDPGRAPGDPPWRVAP